MRAQTSQEEPETGRVETAGKTRNVPEPQRNARMQRSHRKIIIRRESLRGRGNEDGKRKTIEERGAMRLRWTQAP